MHPECGGRVQLQPRLANDDWLLFHWAAPALGWTMLWPRRLIPGAVAFSEHETREFGRMVQALSQALIDATGAERVYLASLREATRHFHFHFVPRYEDGPAGWDAFVEVQRAADGLVEIDADRVAQVIDQLGASLVVSLGGRARQKGARFSGRARARVLPRPSPRPVRAKRARRRRCRP